MSTDMLRRPINRRFINLLLLLGLSFYTSC